MFGPEEDLLDSEFVEIYREAVDLYALVHARYIVTPRGLQAMRAKYLKSMFGSCPAGRPRNSGFPRCGSTARAASNCIARNPRRWMLMELSSGRASLSSSCRRIRILFHLTRPVHS